MAKQAQFTKERIIGACMEILRAEGPDALTARSICRKLGCSVAPLFWVFENMDELLGEVRKAGQEIFLDYIADSVDYVPAFKEFGLRLIRFSREEPNLFHYLFLEKEADDSFAGTVIGECLKQNEPYFGLSPEQSDFIFRQIWPFACGLALLSNKNPDMYNEDMVSQMLSNQFQALLMLVKSGQQVENIEPKSIKKQ